MPDRQNPRRKKRKWAEYVKGKKYVVLGTSVMVAIALIAPRVIASIVVAFLATFYEVVPRKVLKGSSRSTPWYGVPETVPLVPKPPVGVDWFDLFDIGPDLCLAALAVDAGFFFPIWLGLAQSPENMGWASLAVVFHLVIFIVLFTMTLSKVRIEIDEEQHLGQYDWDKLRLALASVVAGLAALMLAYFVFGEV